MRFSRASPHTASESLTQDTRRGVSRQQAAPTGQLRTRTSHTRGWSPSRRSKERVAVCTVPKSLSAAAHATIAAGSLLKTDA
jgi:hypothetical protein